MPLGPNILTFKEVISRIKSFYLFPTDSVVQTILQIILQTIVQSIVQLTVYGP